MHTMILQSCCFQLTPKSCFSNSILLPYPKRCAKILNRELRNSGCLNSRSNSFEIRALETDATTQLGDEIAESSRTKSEYDHLIWPSPNDEIPFWKRDFPSWDLNSEDPIDIQNDSDVLHIVHVTAEMAPIAKVGGLGDVVTGLARACLIRGHNVDVYIPFYECINKQHIDELALVSTYNSYHDGIWVPTNVYRGVVSGINVVFIEPSNHFFKGSNVYGGSYNELEAYLFFSRACLEWLQVTSTQPDIIHVHEWQTGGLPLLYWDMYHHLSLKKPRIVLTIHNMEHYGECSQEQLGKCGLDGSSYATEEKVRLLNVLRDTYVWGIYSFPTSRFFVTSKSMKEINL